jgi:hypothetical protein
MFFKGSRYAKVETTSLIDDRKRERKYKKVRFIPDTTPRYGYAVAAGDRLDNVSFAVFRDPERFWRICDANRTMWPDELTDRPGRVIGIPGAED